MFVRTCSPLQRLEVCGTSVLIATASPGALIMTTPLSMHSGGALAIGRFALFSVRYKTQNLNTKSSVPKPQARRCSISGIRSRCARAPRKQERRDAKRGVKVATSALEWCVVACVCGDAVPKSHAARVYIPPAGGTARRSSIPLRLDILKDTCTARVPQWQSSGRGSGAFDAGGAHRDDCLTIV